MNLDALYDDLSMGENPGASNEFYLTNKVNEVSGTSSNSGALHWHMGHVFPLNC